MREHEVFPLGSAEARKLRSLASEGSGTLCNWAGFRVQGLGFRGLGFRVQGLGFTVQGSGFRV